MECKHPRRTSARRVVKARFDCEIGRDMGDLYGSDLVLGNALTSNPSGWLADNVETRFDLCSYGFKKIAGSLLGLRKGQKGRFRITIERLPK